MDFGYFYIKEETIVKFSDTKPIMAWEKFSQPLETLNDAPLYFNLKMSSEEKKGKARRESEDKSSELTTTQYLVETINSSKPRLKILNKN